MKLSKKVRINEQPDLEPLLEVKLSRLYQHFKGDAPVAIITAFRGERDLATNTKLNRELASTLRSAGLGYVWVDGSWIENSGSPDENHVSEVAILAIGNGESQSDDKLLSTLSSAATKYDQDGFIFKGVGHAPLKLYDKNGEVVTSFERVSMDTISDMYTKLRSGNHKGRSFVFEAERTPVGFMGRMMGLSE